MLKNSTVRNCINAWYILKFRMMKKQYGLNNTKREREIVVSLTSFPARMDKIHLCIRSLLMQNMKPDRIVIYLGDKEFEGIALPETLTELFQYGVEVRFRKDLKPHTKYFYAMQEFPDALIVTVDDDIYYRPDLIKVLYRAHEQHPDCVVCTRAHKMLFENGVLLPYNSWDYETKCVNQESHLLMATGVGGVLYDPKLFHKELFDEKAIEELTLKQDDVWLKFMEILSGIKVFAVPASKTKYLVGIWGSEKTTLNSQNVGQNKNDVYISNVMNHCNIRSSDLEELK